MKSLFDKGVIVSQNIKTDSEIYNHGVSVNIEDLPEFLQSST